MNTLARIGIVGAGCAGLTAAEELRGLGFKNVTVLESKSRSGGKIFSMEHTERDQDFIVEGGTVWMIPSPLYDRYSTRYGLARDIQYTAPIKLVDLDTGRISSPYFIHTSVPVLQRITQFIRFFFVAKPFGKVGKVGYADPAYRELHMSPAVWYKKNGFQFVYEAFTPITNAAQMGYVEKDIPVLYVLRLIGLLLRFSPLMLLTLRLPKLRKGNQELWKRMAATHHVHYGMHVQRVQRNRNDDIVYVDAEDREGGRHSYEFDHLIWTAPIDDFVRVADSTSAELDVFCRVRSIKRAIFTCRVENLATDSIYFIKNSIEQGFPLSHPFVFFEAAPGSKLFNFYPFMDDKTTIEEMEQHIRKVVTQMGGTYVERVRDPIIWKWFPYFSGEDVHSGIFERLEALQGQQNTYFAGEVAAGISVPFGMEYAAKLVSRFFQLA
jgi:protoporphyrinogen/coproporphyrinogen III oxidase